MSAPADPKLWQVTWRHDGGARGVVSGRPLTFDEATEIAAARNAEQDGDERDRVHHFAAPLPIDVEAMRARALERLGVGEIGNARTALVLLDVISVLARDLKRYRAMASVLVEGGADLFVEEAWKQVDPAGRGDESERVIEAILLDCAPDPKIEEEAATP